MIRYLASLLALLTAGCFSPTQKVIYKGIWNGMTYVVKTHETHTWNGSRTDWVLRLGKLPEIPINITIRWGTPITLKGEVTTDWGVPYSDDIFERTPHTYFGEKPDYSSAGDEYKDSVVAQHDYTMLYLPAGFSNADYQQYAALMKAEWTKVDKALAYDSNNYFPHLIGLVQAPRSRFIQRFRGMAKGQKMVLRVDPDGYVYFGPDDEVADQNHDRHAPVKMPRKAIMLHELYLWTDYGATKADIQTFRDTNGKSPEAYFVLVD